jgi:hypothetical protein
MKRFEQLTNKDKAQHLHELFPGEMSALIAFIQGTAKAVAKKDESNHDQATADMFPGFTPSELKKVADETRDSIDSFFHLMNDNSQFFAEQLFNDNLYGFVLDCMKQYARICPNKKIQQYIDLYFIDEES